ncbi:hypothetical protein N0V90_007114 [Kalmusia sp. IMI 367209]|nr:hypothetical protein N0V90_007114 [Kalmusia sp. IMI 367209]
MSFVQATKIPMSSTYLCIYVYHPSFKPLLQEFCYSKHWPVIQSLAADTSPTSSEKLRKYILEALRLVGSFPCTFHITALDGTVNDDSVVYKLKNGDTIFLDLKEVGRDPSKLSDPTEIELDRPEENYIHFGWGIHTCLGRYIAGAGLTEQFRVFGKLKVLKRAPGSQGRLRVKKAGTVTSFLSDGGDAWSRSSTSALPWFCSTRTHAISGMKIHYDAMDESKLPCTATFGVD